MVDETLVASYLCLTLMRIGTKTASGFDQHFQKLGLTQAQFRLLLTVREQGHDAGLSPSALADHLLIERSSVSTLIEVLVKRGWVVRVPGKNRRTYQIVLTDLGGQILQQAIPSAIVLADYIFSNLTRDELQQLQTLFGGVEARLRDYHPPVSPEVL